MNQLKSTLIFFTLFLTTFLCSPTWASEDGENAGNEIGNGFGNQYKWVKFDEAFTTAKEEGKPVMLLITKSWCGACKSLKPKFAASTTIPELSEKFVMVNVIDDEEPSEEKYKPDGGYIPRILFFDSDGELLNVINEGGNKDYKYFYNNDNAIVDSMKRALAATKSEGDVTDDSASVDDTDYELREEL